MGEKEFGTGDGQRITGSKWGKRKTRVSTLVQGFRERAMGFEPPIFLIHFKTDT